MPHQEHLSQAGGRFAHRGRVPGAPAWLAALIVGLCLWLAGGQAPAATSEDAEAAITPLLHAEAVRSHSWRDAAPPTSGWVPVTLPDAWNTRWPDFDGVVWYRLQWEAPATPTGTVGLLLPYLNMAGALYLNGVEIHRDPSLVEPLTRAWNTPHYWLLPKPLWHAGTNTLLVRVSGLADFQAGLGPLSVGPAAAVQQLDAHERLMRRDLQVLGLAVSSGVALFFGVLWLLRPRDTAYGWFTLLSLLWMLVGLDQVVTSPWPFASTSGWQAANTVFFVGFSAIFTICTLHFCGLQRPRLSALLLALTGVCVLDLWWIPAAAVGLHRTGWIVAGGILTLAVCVFFMVHAGLQQDRWQRALAPFMAIVALAGVHDLLVFTQVVHSNLYYTTMASYVLLLGMAMTMAARFFASLERTEHFNEELLHQVDHAKAELGATLAQQHRLEVAHARLGERVNLVSDLHDGLGGMLVGSIATLENTPDELPPPKLLAMLKNLRDDLRLIIDVTGNTERADPLGELLVPLRHRITSLLDSNGIECRWQLTGIDTLELGSSQSLDVLRFIQEALTNVLKHSGGRRAKVSLLNDGGLLSVTVRDDGRGFTVDDDAFQQGSGAGLRNMRMRARRLGGTLQVRSSSKGTRTTLQVRLPRPA